MGELTLHEDEVPAHVDDLVDVLVHHGALLLAGVAGGAGPDLLGGDHVADQAGGRSEARQRLRPQALAVCRPAGGPRRPLSQPGPPQRLAPLDQVIA